MLAVDLHAHTRFFHGKRRLGDAFDPIGARLLALTARRRGLDAVALTNHDYYAPFDSTDPAFLPGIEISSTEGHVLVVGEDPPRRTDPGALTPDEAVALAHERDCAAIMAHPFRSGSLRRSDAPFDAVEVNGKHPEFRGRVRSLAAERDLPVVGGSDAHFPVEVGRAYTLVDCDEPTPAAVVAAIRDGRVEPRIREGRFHRVLREAYTAIHERKGDI